MPEDKNKAVWITVVTGLLALFGTILGGVINGFADIKLERAKLDSQLILGALESDSITTRRESLEFLVETHLIEDKTKRMGIKKYFEGDTPKQPPIMKPFIRSGENQILTPRTQDNAQRIDVTIFVCGKQTTSVAIGTKIKDINAKLAASGNFGLSELKVWEGQLYDEIPLNQLDNKVTLVLDYHHPEFGEYGTFESALKPVPLNLVRNPGPETPWRASLIVC